MKFGSVPIAQAPGTILAHSLQLPDGRLKKGKHLDAAMAGRIAAAGFEEVIVARLDKGDVSEDDAASVIAGAFSGEGIEVAPAATGRANLHAAQRGLFRADKALVNALNAIDPDITFACLADRSVVQKGDMVATIKIIPLAVPGASVGEACAAISARGIAGVKPFRKLRAAMVATRLPTLKASVMEKTRSLTAGRLGALGSDLAAYKEVGHETGEVAEAIRILSTSHDLVLVFGASAVTDAADVIPQAIREAGGSVERVGMPVDPGNLLVLGEVSGVPVIGAPGCARSPKENGFDWVLARILAGEAINSADISAMGVGGLLMEIPTRPQPRQFRAETEASRVAIIVLAAGSASRMGEGAGHKLLATFEGEPLIRRLSTRACASSARQVVVVTGHRAEDIAAATAGTGVTLIHNPDHATGMASSIKCGLAALPTDIAGAMILLGDMPGLTTAHLDKLVEGFLAEGGASILRASDGNHRGNPVIVPSSMFPELSRLEGDTGARVLIETSGLPIVDLDIGPAACLDVDTPEAVRAAGGVIEAGK